ncbi:receptor-like protein kinase ANXUR1 [Hordeum vulgare]|uniref:Protein kinase domain-containing protein n=1 Tax=Hordeum vulgare subsp. vulgare TaxID=112509 RepID=A0A8I6YDY5_HORVV|nr:receptor-like protein kinase ANXUR2 [Hordeum vulgare subsp. vulgare]KAE8796813.1 receptor-like protein kinase ANXUR1 [Hordeum vulgare]
MHVLAAVMGGAAAAICCVAMAACLYVHKRKKKTRNGELSNVERLLEYRSPATGGGGGRSFSLAEIKAATENFREALVVGVGRQGKVFRGVVDGGTAVAIKLANPSPGRSAREFRAEIETLSNLRHRHLVPLLGFCSDREETILVYRHMPRGTLREHLHGKSGKPAMPWWRRLDACMGAARGLHCLHAGGVVHGDVRTTTILVDENWVAKLSDFGLSNSKHATMESDVYSFGVVLFEALMAWRPALLPGDQAVGLAGHALACHRNGTLPDAVDAAIKGQVAPECLEKFAGMAAECLAHQGTERPAMGDVLWNLELSMQLQLINPKRT